MTAYSIQWLKRVKGAWFRQDLTALLDLLQHRKIEPLVAARLPFADAKRAHELLGQGGVTGKIVLVNDTASVLLRGRVLNQEHRAGQYEESGAQRSGRRSD